MSHKSKLNLKGKETIRVNVRSLVNNAEIRRETVEGREFIVIPSTTMPDDIVMNGVYYSADVIGNSFGTLEGTPAPLGHPMTPEGDFRSAFDPMAQIVNGVGAINRNVKRKNGIVHADKFIDVETAQGTERGRRVLNAIDRGDPIHTSTGLYCELQEATEELRNETGKDFDFAANAVDFDHDAILLDEDGAATPEQGVGMMVNKALDAKNNRVSVMNVDLDDMIEGEIDYLGMQLVDALDRRENVSRWRQIKAALAEMFGTSERETETNSSEDEMSAETDKKVAEIAEGLASLTETVTQALEGLGNSMKENESKLDALSNSLNREEEAHRKTLIEGLVNNQVLTQDDADNTPTAVLESLSNHKPQAGQGLRGATPAMTNKSTGALTVDSLLED